MSAKAMVSSAMEKCHGLHGSIRSHPIFSFESYSFTY
jgi:hypothetical protein